ncbi:hypothetical protein E0198_000654 [Clavispora lusitaniae]|nr:hypothetical protein E0198_000654 [Clavispora lusitaniae]
MSEKSKHQKTKNVRERKLQKTEQQKTKSETETSEGLKDNRISLAELDFPVHTSTYTNFFINPNTAMFKSVFKTGIRSTYNVSENASFHTESWAVYPAKHRSTGKAASVFIFDKTKFETSVQRMCSQSPNTTNPRLIISECYELIKKEVSKLTKLKHPQILTVLEVLEETRSKFIFATEAVVANLVTLDLNKEDELSIQKGLLEVSKGLQFLHNFCSTIHLNLQPSSVFVTSSGDWKLAGFKFLQNLNELSVSERENFYIMNNSSIVPFANLNLNFTAPELIMDSSNLRLDTANDLWSLGLFIYYVYNKGEHLISCFDSNSPSEFKAEFRKFEQKFYNHRVSELKYLLKDIPESLWSTLTHLLARYPNDRITIDQFIDSDFFSGSLIKTMWFIDEYSTKSIDEKLIFLSGLVADQGALLKKLPVVFKNSKLLPLLAESTSNELNLLGTKKLDADTDSLISQSFNVIMLIGQDLSGLSFQDRIYATMLDSTKKRKDDSSPLLKLARTSVKCRLEIINHLDVMTKKLSQKQVTDIVRDIAELCLTYAPNEVDVQADQIKLQESFLQNLELVIEMFDFPYIKKTLFPLVCQVFKTTTILSTKLQTIATFQMLIDKNIIDKVIVNEQLLPVVENSKSRDKRIISGILFFFTKLSQSEHIALDLETLVDKVLVQCLRLAFGCSGCSKAEFQQFMRSIEGIQSTLTQRKLQTLTESDASSTNFDSLINTPSLRQAGKDDTVKGPQSKPIAPAQANSSRPTRNQSAKHTSTGSVKPARPSHVKPLTLKPTQKTPLSFGAIDGDGNSGFGKPMLFKNQTSAGDEFEDFQDGSSSNNTSIDWSSAKSSQPRYDTPSATVLSPTMRNQETFSSSAIGNSSSTVKYPPGYNASVVLTPSSTGSTPTPKPQNNEDLLNFL